MTVQTFQKGAGKNKLTYPLDAKQIRDLQKCKIVSPRVGKHHGIVMPAALCNDASRKEALAEVMAVREQVKAGEFPRAFMEKYYPDDWGTFPKEIPALLAREGLSFDDPEGLADVVHMDNPVDLGAAMLGWVLGKINDNQWDSFPFLDLVPGAMAGMARDVHSALVKAFDVKYYYGIARPEEVGDGPGMTHYDEGSPAHPSFPAGHGAAAFASAVYFLREVPTLSDADKKALFDAAYIWAMARTFAGVHYAVDNLTFAPRRAEV